MFITHLARRFPLLAFVFYFNTLFIKKTPASLRTEIEASGSGGERWLARQSRQGITTNLEAPSPPPPPPSVLLSLSSLSCSVCRCPRTSSGSQSRVWKKGIDGTTDDSSDLIVEFSSSKQHCSFGESSSCPLWLR